MNRRLGLALVGASLSSCLVTFNDLPVGPASDGGIDASALGGSAGAKDSGIGGAAGTAGTAGTAGGSTAPVRGSLAAGMNHACATTKEGSVYCWGYGPNGELGAGPLVKSSRCPVAVSDLVQASWVGAGNWHSCAAASDQVYCWGTDESGQLGDGEGADDSGPTWRDTPVVVSGLGVVTKLSVGHSHSCVIDEQLRCWGANSESAIIASPPAVVPAPEAVLAVPGPREVAAGWNFTLATASDGRLFGWGHNGSGQLGEPAEGTVVSPRLLTGLPARVRQISAGHRHACAVLEDNTLWCWGDNNSAALGLGTVLGNVTTPSKVERLGAGVAMVSAGGGHTCAVLLGGTAWCWGNNEWGQLGVGRFGDSAVETFVKVPEMVADLKDVAEIATGGLHTCARPRSGEIYCWGANNLGQVGNDTLVDRYERPQPVGCAR
jgi:alpha-tubulin suppressor-like RCC1 family protein